MPLETGSSNEDEGLGALGLDLASISASLEGAFDGGIDSQNGLSSDGLSAYKIGLRGLGTRLETTARILDFVKAGEALTTSLIDVISGLLLDTNLEPETRVNLVKALIHASNNNPDLFTILDNQLDDKNIFIKKMIMEKFINSDYHFQNIRPIEEALYDPQMLQHALHTLNKAADGKYLSDLQYSTNQYLNQLLDNESVSELAIRILSNEHSGVVTNFDALCKLLSSTDKNIVNFSYESLNNICDKDALVPGNILDALIKTSIDPNVPYNERITSLNILNSQIGLSASNSYEEFSWLSDLQNNLDDENLDISSRTIKIFRKAFEKKIKLPGSILDNIVKNSSNLSENRFSKADIKYCLSIIQNQDLADSDFSEINNSETFTSGTYEKPLDDFLNEIRELNKNNDAIESNLLDNDLLKNKYHCVIDAYNNDSQISPLGKAICQWEKIDVNNWAKKIKETAGNNSPDTDSLPEMMALIKRASFLSSGNDPRLAQVLSVLTLLMHEDGKGRLLQIATGEGKSTTSAMLAAMLALRGQKVDIATSSSLLAERDAEEKAAFYAMFNLTVAHNSDNQQSKGPKKCYKADIVYGALSCFQGDSLRDEYLGFGTRSGRPYANLIVDEVDSMLIDDASKIVKLSSPISSMEYLQGLLASGSATSQWLLNHLVYSQSNNIHYFIRGDFEYKDGILKLLPSTGQDASQIPTPLEVTDAREFQTNYLTNFFKELIASGQVPVPNYLANFVLSQIENWASSLISANSMQLNKDYIIKESFGIDVIAPVDYSATGIVQDKTSWQNGLQQFLQLKHGLKLTAESFTTSFISNMEYVLRYGSHIFGMTGTLGSKDSQDLLMDTYPIDIAIIPTYTQKQFTPHPDIIASSQNEWLAEIYHSTKNETNKNRAVLIICQTIQDAQNIHSHLSTQGLPANKLKLYTRSDTDEAESINRTLQPQDVIIATNLAGRGTDIKTSNQVEQAGGLHVTLTFLPENLRIEEQAFGRTSRQGSQGSACLIIDKSALTEKYGDIDVLDSIAGLKQLRDNLESQKLAKAKTTGKQKLQLWDNLFREFTKFTKELRKQDNDEYKLRQLDELWGLKFRDIQTNFRAKEKSGASLDEIASYAKDELAKFMKHMRSEYNTYAIYKNPSIMVRAAINKLGAGDSYRESIAMLDYAANLDDVYNFSALYNRAYAKISQGYMESQQKDKAITYWQSSAADDLAAAKYRIEGKILPQLVSLQLIANQNPQSALFKQVTAKIKILQKTNQYIDGALKTIASSNGNVTKIDAPRILNELFSPHHPPIEEINEMGAFGIVQLFKVEVVERQVNPLEVLFVGILAFAQVVIGTICVHTGMVSFGVNMISNGIQDMIKASELASGNLSIKNYFVGKGIELAVFALTMGIEKVASLATSASRNAANQAAGQMTQSTADAIVKNALLTTAVGIGVDYAISGACEVATRGFEDDVHDAVGRQVHTAFEKSHLRQDLAYIWLVDGFTHTNRGERAIEEAISDTLLSKHSLAATMAEQTLTAMSHSTSASVKAIGYAARIAKASCDITKITEFSEDFCDSFAGKVGYIKSRLPTISDLMYKDMRLVNRNDAPKIMEILEQHSVMIHGHIQPDYAQKLSGVELDDAVHVRLSAFVNKLAAAGAGDTNARLNRLAESITEVLTSRVLGQIHTQITTPLAREGSRQTGLIDRISDKLEEGAAHLRDAFNKSRIENGARIVDLNTTEHQAAVSKPKVGGIKHETTSANAAYDSDTINHMQQSSQQLKTTIDFEIDRLATLPKNLTQEQAAKTLAIRMEVKDRYGQLDTDIENKIVGLAYKLNEKYETNPELVPGQEVASLGGIANLGIRLVTNELTAAVRVAAGKYLYNIISPELTKIGVEVGLIGDYNDLRSEIFEKTKVKGEKSVVKYKETSGSTTSPMPSPDAWEPEEDKNRDKNESNNDFDKYIKDLKEGEKIDPTKIKYEDAPYHHKFSVGEKSKSPTDPQSGLDYSYKLSDSSDRLIGFDAKNNEFIVYDRTGGDTYHGHVRTWDKLNIKQQNALIKSKVISPTGKFLIKN